jgi:hypothetical protein
MNVNKIIATLSTYFNVEISEAHITGAPGKLYLLM